MERILTSLQQGEILGITQTVAKKIENNRKIPKDRDCKKQSPPTRPTAANFALKITFVYL